jgi:integrase
MPGYHAGRPPRNKGQRYPADPPPVEEIIRVMRTAGDGPAADRFRGLIVVLWRSGLRISEALALAESDLDRARGAILVRRGKGGKRREVGMDSWGWEQLDPWLQVREQLPVGALFCIICGPTRGRPWTQDAVRVQLRRTAARAAVRRRFAPHQLRHAHAVEMAREGVPIMVIQRQLGQANLGITSIYLQGIDNAEIIGTPRRSGCVVQALRTAIRAGGNSHLGFPYGKPRRPTGASAARADRRPRRAACRHAFVAWRRTGGSSLRCRHRHAEYPARRS